MGDKGTICLVSHSHESIPWLSYFLQANGWAVEAHDEESARRVNLDRFDYTIFDLPGHSYTRRAVQEKLGNFSWVPDRTIVRFDFGHTFHGEIEGLRALDIGAPVEEYRALL